VNQFASLKEFEDYPIDGSGLRLRDVATVSLREPDLDYGDTSTAAAPWASTSSRVGREQRGRGRAANKVLRDRGRPGAARHPGPDLHRPGQGDPHSLDGLLHAGLVGAALAIVVLFFFLRRLATTLIVADRDPVRAAGPLAMLYFGGRSLNILSMMGLMLAVGMLVDNAVVILESIHRHRERGTSRLRAALQGSREVLPAVSRPPSPRSSSSCRWCWAAARR